jgi:hypothetical protein
MRKDRVVAQPFLAVRFSLGLHLHRQECLCHKNEDRARL